MGLYLSTYIGPAVIAKRKIGEVVDPYRACGKESCNRFKKKQDGSYCNQCGSPIQTFRDKTKTSEKPTYDEICDALEAAGLREDAINVNKFAVVYDGYRFIEFSKKPPNNSHPESSDAAFFEEVSAQDILDQLAWYRENCKAELEVIASLFDEFELKWVVVCYYS